MQEISEMPIQVKKNSIKAILHELSINQNAFKGVPQQDNT